MRVVRPRFLPFGLKRRDGGRDRPTQTETQYTACACSPVGKPVKTSRPYRSGQTPVWTETRYDALGRPTAVILPDGNQTTYTYSVQNDATWKGSLTLITDPAGKQKRYLYDAFGRLLRVDEPDPTGALVETARYTYDTMGRLTTVQMSRRADGTFKQTRSFVYNTAGQLTSATNEPIVNERAYPAISVSAFDGFKSFVPNTGVPESPPNP